ncbi:MAG TPA: hypothetical protein DCF33_05780 [Saprospirales bacterium]|nr:hypothetical protein [Saprospirales bacterium]
MKHYSILVAVTLCFLEAGQLPAQGSLDKYHKNIFIELGGRGLAVSANFDMRLKRGVQNGWGVRAGAGTSLELLDAAPKVNGGPGLLTFPVAVNYLVGRRRSSFDAGIGLTPIHVNYEKISIVGDKFLYGPRWALFGLLHLGYRFQPLRRGVMFGGNVVLGRWSGGSYTTAGFFLGYGFK